MQASGGVCSRICGLRPLPPDVHGQTPNSNHAATSAGPGEAAAWTTGACNDYRCNGSDAQWTMSISFSLMEETHKRPHCRTFCLASVQQPLCHPPTSRPLAPGNEDLRVRSARLDREACWNHSDPPLPEPPGPDAGVLEKTLP